MSQEGRTKAVQEIQRVARVGAGIAGEPCRDTDQKRRNQSRNRGYTTCLSDHLVQFGCEYTDDVAAKASLTNYKLVPS